MLFFGILAFGIFFRLGLEFGVLGLRFRVWDFVFGVSDFEV